MALQLTAAGTAINVALESISYDEKVDDPVTCSFDVPDTVGYSLSQYQVINVSDTATSTTLFTGFIDTVADQAFPGNTGIKMRSVTCTGNRWRAEKRIWTGGEFNGWLTGDAVAEMHRAVLASEGVTAPYALRHDYDATSFGQGTLAGTVVAGNTLTLAKAGTDFTQTESVTADFATGTLTNTVAVNNALALTSFQAIKYTGSVGANLDNNTLYAKRKIWVGTNYTIVAGDQVWFDVWIDSRSPEIKASVDLMYSDGTFCSEVDPTALQDQFTIHTDPFTDLKGWADDQWFSRTCTVSSQMVGKVIVAVYLVLAGAKGGDYTAYFKNIKLTNAAGATQRTFFSSSLISNVPASSAGYYNLAAKVLPVYSQTGSRVSPSRSITSVGIVKSSVLSWIEIDTIQPTGASSHYPPQVLLETSTDGGASWQTCTNHALLPSLLIGMNTSGISVLVRETLSIGGPNPEKTPLLDTTSFTVLSAAACTKTDFTDFDNTQTTLGTGVLTNATSYTDGVKTTGIYRDWTVTGSSDAPSFASQTVFGSSNPAHGEAENYFFLRTDANTDCHDRFDFAGQWTNFILEIDIHLAVAGCNFGVLYRTTNWDNGQDTYGYYAYIDATHVALGHGSNSVTSAFTAISSFSIALTVGQWYRMKVVVTGSSHQIYLNDVLCVNVTNSFYTGTGYTGVRMFNGATGRQSGHFDNFGIVGYESDLISVSNRVTPALALSGIVGDSRINWQALVSDTSTFLVESTLDNGVTWSPCINGGQIPSLVAGYNAAGKSVKFRFTMTNQAVNLPAILQGYSAFVIGQYSASGTRISPVLAIDAAGTIGSSSLTWIATTPTNTGVAAATSLDNITYTGIAASGNPIAGLIAQGAMVADDFDVNSSANYTLFGINGVAPTSTMTFETANSRLTAVGTGATNDGYQYNGVSVVDGVVEANLDLSAGGGLLARKVDANNMYLLYCSDSTAGNFMALWKIVGGTWTQLGSNVTLAFTRGTYHRVHLSTVGSSITASFDGVQLLSVTDTGVTAAGRFGLLAGSGSGGARYYSLNILPLGASATGKSVYSKLTLTSTDPTVAPVVSNLVTSVRGPDLMTGVLLASTQYAYKSISANITDAAGQSKMYWRIDKNLKLSMKDRSYSMAPWPLYSADPTFAGTNNPPKLTHTSPLYRNRQYVTGAISLSTVPENKLGDGNAQSWVLAYPVDSVSSVTLDGNVQTIGVQGVDTGKNFYYQPGQNVLTADSTLFPEEGAQIAIVYVGRVPYTSMRESTSQQGILAAIDGTTGIVGRSEDCGGLPAAAADAIAQARIDQYAILAVEWIYTTSRGGLAPGNFQSIFVPEHGVVDLDVLITGIHTSIWVDGSTGALNYLYDVSTTSGANVGTWQRIFAQAA